MLARVALAGVVLAGLAGCGRAPGSRTSAPWAVAHFGRSSSSPAPLVSTPPEGISIVAQARNATVDIYESPAAPAASRRLDNPQPSGAPLVFLVQQTAGDWLKVLLPVRPNGSIGWIRLGQVALMQHTYRIVVEETAHRISVYHGAKIIDQEPVGIGTRLTPTPGGLYYTKELLQPPDPNGPYGPYAYGLSGFSNVLSSFNGGDGVIGIHGTNDPATLGHDVSHGCIRMSNAGITRLAHLLPLGVPVEIRP